MRELLKNVDYAKLYRASNSTKHYFVEFRLTYRNGTDSFHYVHDADYDKAIEKANKLVWSLLD